VTALLCLSVAGLVIAQLPGGDFTLAWQHSIEKVRWEEDYRLDSGLLTLTEARVRGSGAGMEIPADAHFQDGRWRYVPDIAPLAILRLGRSTFVGDYDLCQAGHCSPLARWLGEPNGEPVDVQACEHLAQGQRMPGSSN